MCHTGPYHFRVLGHVPHALQHEGTFIYRSGMDCKRDTAGKFNYHNRIESFKEKSLKKKKLSGSIGTDDLRASKTQWKFRGDWIGRGCCEYIGSVDTVPRTTRCYCNDADGATTSQSNVCRWGPQTTRTQPCQTLEFAASAAYLTFRWIFFFFMIRFFFLSFSLSLGIFSPFLLGGCDLKSRYVNGWLSSIDFWIVDSFLRWKVNILVYIYICIDSDFFMEDCLVTI